MTVEQQKDSSQDCRALPARSVGSCHDGESSRRLFYVEPEDAASRSQVKSTESSNQEDEVVRELALSAMTEFRKRLSNSRLSRSPDGAATETRTSGEFSIVSSGVLPCTAHEVIHVLSPDHTDRWNASMIELFGSDFGYGVKVRSIAMNSDEEQRSGDTHLSIKVVHFSGSIPLVSKKTTTLFLDYIEVLTDPNHSDTRAWRVTQALERDDSDGLQASDVLAGYLLEEDREVQHTRLHFLALHSADKLRDHTVQRLQKLASLVTKAGDLALRRRLGTQHLVDPPRSASELSRSSITRSFASLSASASASVSTIRGESNANMKACASCEDSLTGLLKRKRFCRVCGKLVCGSCVSTHEAEYRIGLITRVGVCSPCIERLRREAFALDSYIDYQHLS